MKHSKRYRQAREAVDPAREYPLAEAVQALKQQPSTQFDETVEIAVSTYLDPKKSDQAVRGTISLPNGIGKSLRVIAFCPDDQAEAAVAAGAAEAGGEDLAEKIDGGWLDFDVAVAHPSTMRFVGKLGRILGPKGLMPSPKSGTVVDDVPAAVKEFAAGKLEYRLDSGGNIHAPVGKKSFPDDDLSANIEAFVDHVRRARPSGAKGRYIRSIHLSASMGPSVKVAV
jgi:large subunit ribosomal protein L1